MGTDSRVGAFLDTTDDRSLLERIWTIPDRVAATTFDRWAVNFTYLAFAFVFFYFGVQKPLPFISPVRTPVSIFASELSGLLSFVFRTEVVISTTLAIHFIGAYEMFLGLLFLFRQLRLAFWFFFAHQLVAFAALVLIWDSVFQPPWLTVIGVDIPYILGSFSAFVLKNVVFVGAFMLLASSELGQAEPESESTSAT